RDRNVTGVQTCALPIFSKPVSITGLLMIYVLNPPASWLNNLLLNGLQSLSGTHIMLLGLVIGAMMAIDMGGPFNKAAYVFAVARSEERRVGNDSDYEEV